ncbi:glycosyltransferase [Rhodococcus sp. T2V]|uniref:glycosyltransferase n=1 Tax=Rhodococcus sp. T2V TaxID=3034164 RepID=UPI0023E2021C|nr:glycosyltransferase [Rhodococcus sp. T2V]MDF3312027.1 glycosyltransferase [Rhodococcus sp. T2V]
MIGYYIHHHGRGHRTRAASIAAHLHGAVTALSSVPVPAGPPFAASMLLDRDDRDGAPEDPTAHGVLHWAPAHDTGLRTRMTQIATWVAATRPSVMIVDVSVEITVFVRLLGVPVVVIAQPGERTDTAHRLAYQMADHIVAAWPQEVYTPDWLRPFATKTTFVGGISRFDGRARPIPAPAREPRVLVLGGAGGSTLSVADVRACADRYPRYRWRALGLPGAAWVDDPWPALGDCDVVVTHAGQNAIADLAVARCPAIVIAQQRPFDEQVATAAALGAGDLAVTVPAWPAMHEWPALIEQARRLGGDQWIRWQTTGAARRAAAVIDRLADRPAARLPPTPDSGLPGPVGIDR